MLSPVNKKVDKKFTEKRKKHVEKNPIISIRKTAKLLNVDERTVRRTIKTLGKVSVARTYMPTFYRKAKNFEIGAIKETSESAENPCFVNSQNDSHSAEE